MADIIDRYKDLREDYTSASPLYRANILDPILDYERRDLDRLAKFIAKSIQKDQYDQPQPAFILADLKALEILHKEKDVLPRDEAIESIHRLVRDYLEPEGRQVYGFGPGLSDVISYIFTLDLEDIFDLDLLDKAIEKARQGGHTAKAKNWLERRREIERKNDSLK